jgi:tetratricopeptide (TPR) repeat protein
MVPFDRNHRFTGRESQLSQLQEMLFTKDQSIKIAVIGLGGVGKTQLVLELIYRVREKYKSCSVIWIPAMNMERLNQAYRDAAEQLRIPGFENNKSDIKRLMKDHLSKESVGQWVLVFDNADNIDMWTKSPEKGGVALIDCLPRSKRGFIIFTTRDRKAAIKLTPQSVIKVPEMDEETATQLLQRYLLNKDLVHNEHDTNTLLTHLTHLPLAVIQAAAYINKNGITLWSYLSLLAEQEEEVVKLLSEEFEDDGRYHNVKNPVATTWLISFEEICRRDPLAAELLSFIACVEPKDVPQSLLPPSPSRKKEMDAIGTLDAYSFITKHSADEAFDIHRLVHLAIRGWLRKERVLLQWTEKAVTRLNDVLLHSDHRNRSIWRRYLSHARYALGSNLINYSGENRVSLAWKFAMCLFIDGRFTEAEVPFAEVSETMKRVLGAEHPDTLTSMANLASMYQYQARWKEAEELDVQVLETRRRVLGAEHPDTLTSMNNLASTYRKQGRWKEAEELFVQVIETSRSVLCADVPSTLTSVVNLASTYQNQRRWKDTEELEVQVLETMKKVLGTEHPDTLTSTSDLALTYGYQGRWKEAEELDVQLLETRRRVLGVEHPDTLTSMNNLAHTWKSQKRHPEALKLMEETVELHARVLGVDHPDCVSSSAVLAGWRREKLDG